jgi:ornithine cyclodeaminase/alanine dehydrogenase-like protein (mu-crystallin family)
MIGAGVQARAHLRAIADVRHIEEVRVCARRPGSAEAFAKDMAQLAGIRVRAVNSPAEAIRGAGIVVAATTSREPVIEWSWLEPGTHCCAIGFGTRELATDVLANAVVVAVDTREGALAEADDLKRAIEEKRLEPKRIVEVGEVLLEKARGRSSDRDVTVYRSVGMAAMDAAAAALAFRRAQETNAGTPVAI